MKNITQKIFIVCLLFLSASIFGACNVFKIDITPSPSVATYNIVATALSGGSVSGAGTYQKDAVVTLTATPQNGYFFVNWTSGGVSVYTENTYTFTATQNVVLYANFVSVIGSYYEETENEAKILELNEDGEYKLYEYITQDYFYNLTEQSGTYNLTSTNITFNFEENEEQNQLVYSLNYDTENYNLTLTDEQNTYVLLKFTPIILDGPFTYIVENVTYAIYEFNENSMQISEYHYGPNEVIEYTQSNTSYKILNNYFIVYNDSVDAYEFINFTYENDTLGLFIEQEPTMLNKFTMPDIYYNFIYSEANSSLEIEFLSDNTLVMKETVTVDNEPQTIQTTKEYTIVGNHLFIKDVETQEITGYDYSLQNGVLTMDNKTYFKNGIVIQYTVTTSTTTAAQYVDGLGTYTANQTVTLSIIPRHNYTFIGWRVDGVIISNSNSYTFTITKNTVVQPLWSSNSGGGFEPLPN